MTKICGAQSKNNTFHLLLVEQYLKTCLAISVLQFLAFSYLATYTDTSYKMLEGHTRLKVRILFLNTKTLVCSHARHIIELPCERQTIQDKFVIYLSSELCLLSRYCNEKTGMSHDIQGNLIKHDLVFFHEVIDCFVTSTGPVTVSVIC